jgi:hypothetical protein
VREPFHQGAELLSREGDEDDEGQDEEQDEQDQDDEACSQPSDPDLLHPVRQGVEQVSEGEACHEGQENVP